MITLSVCLSLILLALIAAIFSQQHSDWVLDTDRDKFFPPFFKSEGFYRAFLINLSFAGISTAAAAVQYVKYSSFWMLCDPFMAILLNLGLGLFAALSLSAETKPFKTRERRVWTTSLVVVGMAFFAIAVWTTVELTGPKGPPLDMSRKSVFTFAQSPADDSALQQWFESHLDIRNVILSRKDRQVTVQYQGTRTVLGPSVKEFKTMGYEGSTLVETDLADQPLTWWLAHAPANAWAMFVIASLIMGVLLSVIWRAIGRPRTTAVNPGPVADDVPQPGAVMGDEPANPAVDHPLAANDPGPAGG